MAGPGRDGVHVGAGAHDQLLEMVMEDMGQTGAFLGFDAGELEGQVAELLAARQELLIGLAEAFLGAGALSGLRLHARNGVGQGGSAGGHAGFELGVEGAQFGLHLLALRDVVADADQADDLPPSVADGNLGGENVAGEPSGAW